MENVYFVSTHRIGFRFTGSISTTTEFGLVDVAQRMTLATYIDEIRSHLFGKYYHVIAYLPAHDEAIQRSMLSLVAEIPERMFLVSCDCREAEKLSLMKELGVDPEKSVYWVSDCGGQREMGRLYDAVIATGELPAPEPA